MVNEFLQISQLPPGSIRLRSYGGRSLFNGLLSAPAMRKRAAVLDVLNHFPDSRFFLVGDSGEQDLELYAEIARERPDQILGVFIRDASARDDRTLRPLDDPTGAAAYRVAFDLGEGTPAGSGVSAGGRFGRRSGRSTPLRSMSDAVPETPPAVPKKAVRSYSGTEMVGLAPVSSSASRSSGESGYDYFTSAAPTHSPITEEPQVRPGMVLPGQGQTGRGSDETPREGRAWPPEGFSRPPPGPGQELQLEMRESGRWQPQTPSEVQTPTRSQSQMSEAERKREELQSRLWRARLDVPPQVPIRIFREPEECVEVHEILDRLQMRGR